MWARDVIDCRLIQRHRDACSGNDAVSAGESHVLLLNAPSAECRRGRVWGWGTNEHWKLGFHESADWNFYRTPTPIVGSTLSKRRVVKVAAGTSHSLALTNEGFVMSWGDNMYGKLGHGHRDAVHVPRIVDSLREQGRVCV